MESIALFSISTFCLILSAAWMADRLFPRQPLQSLLSFLVLFLISTSLLQLLLGGMGILNPVAVLGSSVAFTLGVVCYLWKRPNLKETLDPIAALSQLGIGVTMVVGFFGLLPLRSMLAEAWMQLRSVHVLSWDVVSYHLPNAVTYLQAQTWWMVQGTYGHYPGGNEVLNLWSMLFIRSEALLGLTTIALFLGSVLASVVILNLVVPIRSPFWRGIASVMFVGVLVSIPEFQNLAFDVGRNDVTMLFWELVVVWTFLRSKTRTDQWAILTGITLGLLIGTKPNGLYFLLGMLLLNIAIPNSELDEPIATRIRTTLLKILLPSLIIGGGWYVRNLILIGKLTPAAQLKAAADLSIVQSLSNPALYTLNSPFIILAFATVLSFSILTTAVAFRPIDRIDRPPLPQSSRFAIPLGLQIIAAWNLIAIIAMIVTPSGAGYLAGAGKAFLIQIRYSAIVMPITGILVIYILSVLLDRVLQPTSWLNRLERRRVPPQSKKTLAIAAGTLAFLTAAQLASYRTPEGLPGYDGIFFPMGQQESNVYRWVQKNIQASTIYAIGLRPYGLLGDRFSNRVIDRLGTSGWTWAEGELVVATQKPNFVAVCVDPFDRSIPLDELKKMAGDGSKFNLVYQDDLAIVFRVVPK
ncbi:MAG: hypothetical protein H7237_02910 [Alkalinema sp. FL-bin-369]|nr:hypothetical protein [Leptolyngbyaceae cyanobacterium LF-bin-369]